jgi:UDP-N-acetylmuramoylalanine--D-glutamate ligase
MINLPKSISVIGSGVSAIEVAKFAISKGIDVFISDSAKGSIVKERLENSGLKDIEFEGDGNSEKVFESEIIVVSPGVPITANVIVGAKKRDIRVIGAMEFGFQNSVADFVAVTGSAGKSTTVSLINELFKSADIEVELCGNIGTPVIAKASRLSKNGVAVCEVSSFQLETIESFAPKIALILNLAPNHLDRHSSLDEYYSTKFRIIENMSEGALIINGNDERLVEFIKSGINKNLEIISFGKVLDGYTSLVEKSGKVEIYTNGISTVYGSLENLQLIGKHNILNALATAAVAFVCRIPAINYETALDNFGGLEHRLEFVDEINNIKFYNDSKAITPESIVAAVSDFSDGSVRLIIGGKDKGGDFKAIKSLLKDKTLKLYIIGDCSNNLSNIYAELPHEIYETLDGAIKSAFNESSSGEVVLLSPGCASFDMFRNYIDRGLQFKRVVREIASAR